MSTTQCLMTALLLALALPAGAQTPGTPLETYDLVISGGRVIDPESKLDAVRNIGIQNGRISVISEAPLKGTTVLDATGHAVAPGFIDIHSHMLLVPSNWMQAFDGVTTALDLEAGALPISDRYQRLAREGRPLNYGFSASWAEARQVVLAGGATDMAWFGRPDWQKLATRQQSAEILKLVEQAVKDGAIGIGLLVGYARQSNIEEYLGAGKIAARYGVPTFTHLRHVNATEPNGKIQGHEELIAVAAMTGAHMHLCHFNSTASRMLPEIVPMLRAAQRLGLRITVEAYPYGAGSTVIGAQNYAPDNLENIGIAVNDIYYVPAQKRISSKEELAEIRKKDPTGTAVFFVLDEDKQDDRAILDMAVMYQDSVIASDAIWYVRSNGRILTEPVWPIPEDAYAHPRSAGTFTRILGRYVRERKQLTLMEAIRRASLLPAQILEDAAPQMKNKGRIKIGADADIIVFDPQTVIDKATYTNPRLPAEGMRHVIVNGVPVILDGKLNTAVRPGKAIRGPLQRQAIAANDVERPMTNTDVLVKVRELRAAAGLEASASR
jgi:hypothetical protein